MTYKEIYSSLIDETLRLLGGPHPGETWCDAAERIGAQIMSPEVPNIHNLESDLEAVAVQAGDRTQEARLARNIIQNLKAAKDMPAKHREYLCCDPTEQLDQIAESLERESQTVASYHLMEILGSESELQHQLEQRTGAAIRLQVTPADSNIVIQEKLSFGKKTMWVTTRLLPMITVWRAD